MSITQPLTRPLTQGITRALTAPSTGGGAAPAFDPASAFGGSDTGAAYDNMTAANLFQASGGTTAVALGDPIGYTTDLSGKANPCVQATSNARPIHRGWPSAVGAELLSNGDFASDTVWTKGTDWVISGGQATKTAGTASLLTQTLALTPGKFYLVQHNILRTAGTLTPQFTGGTTVAGIARNYEGSYYDILQAVTGNTTLAYSADSAFAGAVLLAEVSEVTEWVLPGAMFDGTNDKLVTAAFDASGSNTGTIIIAGKRRPAAGNSQMAQYGHSTTQVRTIVAEMITSPRCTFSDGTTSANVAQSSESKYYDTLLTVMCDADGATVADQIKLRARGYDLPGTPSATRTSTGPLAAAGRLSMGGPSVNSNNFWPGLITREFFINRLPVDEAEVVQWENWVREGYIYAAVIGDSISAERSVSNPAPYAYQTSALVGGFITGPADIAKSGDRIADQKTLWAAVTGKDALELVTIQVGANDVKGRVGENTATSAQVIADYQDLVDTVAADCPQARIHIAGVTPCKLWLDAADFPTEAYQAWLDLNEAIAGNGPTPITGVHQRITSHVAALNDGAGNLAAQYAYNSTVGDGVHPGSNARFIIARAWRAAAVADGLLPAGTAA